MKKTPIQIAHANFLLCRDLVANYGFGSRHYSTHIPDSDYAQAGVTIYGTSADNRLWALATFGRTGWKADGHSDGWQDVSKDVDGVNVRIFKAFECDEPLPDGFALDPIVRHLEESEVAA